MDIIEIISTIISFGSLIVSYMAINISKKNSRQQRELAREQRELTGKQGELTQRLQDQDEDFERKRFITALWDKMANVVEIHPNDQNEYDEHDIFDALNTLELVAICWKNNIIDQKMVFLVFGGSYRSRVDEIKLISKPLKDLRANGSKLLQERQIILDVYDEINNMAKKKVSA